MQAVIFHVEADNIAGGYVATAVGHGITTQAETIPELKRMVADAVRCHFDTPVCIALRLARQRITVLLSTLAHGDENGLVS